MPAYVRRRGRNSERRLGKTTRKDVCMQLAGPKGRAFARPCSRPTGKWLTVSRLHADRRAFPACGNRPASFPADSPAGEKSRRLAGGKAPASLGAPNAALRRLPPAARRQAGFPGRTTGRGPRSGR